MTESQIQEILDRLDAQDGALKAIQETLKPIAKAYNDANTIFRFFNGTLLKTIIVLGSIAGAVITLKELFKLGK